MVLFAGNTFGWALGPPSQPRQFAPFHANMVGITNLMASRSSEIVNHSLAASLTSPIFSLGEYFFNTDSLWYCRVLAGV